MIARTDPGLLKLTRKIKNAVVSGHPEKLADLLTKAADSRGITRGEMVKLIEETAEKHGLADRQIDAWRAS